MDRLLHRLAELAETFSARAGALDEAAGFPAENIADLRRIGALSAPSPRDLGGSGAGTQPEGALALLQMLRLIGRAHLATGRLFEAHVNALKLIATYGTPAQMARAARDTEAGHLFALWVTESSPGVRLADGVLSGAKIVCSGAGHVARAVITAQPEEGDKVLVLVALDNADRARPSTAKLQGMRAAATGTMDLTGLPADPAAIIGQPGDYLRQPTFSAGAWRTSAVTLGGLEKLVQHVRGELCARSRADNPHQLARVGQMLIAQETAHLWLQRAAPIAESAGHPPGDIAAYVNLARIAVECAALDIIRLTQRSLGLAALTQGHPAEALMRDLATYLRQPAPDETLTEAAAWFMQRELPP
jgi:alkylation response protein AidB-like acyl-CoA dehydrogenase